MEQALEGIQEDGRTFLTFKKDEDEEKPVIKDDGKTIDLSFLPEESRGQVEKLFGLLEEKFSAQIDGLKSKADMVDVLLEQLKNLRQPGTSNEATPPEKKSLFDDVKFEENDYYSKFFKRTFQAIEDLNKRLESVGSSITADKVQTAEEKMRSFFEKNKFPKEVVQKMDEIAQNLGGGGKAYNNLDRLAKLAKFELGIAEKPAPESDRSVPRRKSSVFEFSSTRKTGTEKPVINNMMDAWAAAEDQLSLEK
jgi:hypothetical protein